MGDTRQMMGLTCEAFSEALASREPVPGGGGAAAYVGALAAALCSMVGNFTSGKRTYAAYQADIERLLAEAEALRRELVELVEADAAAFSPLAAAYALPKADASRAQVIEEATKGALVPPLKMVRACARVVALLEEMGEKGSRMLVSDVGCSAYLAVAALRAAALNVFVNTASLADRAYAQEVEREVDDLLSVWVPRAEACAGAVLARIRG